MGGKGFGLTFLHNTSIYGDSIYFYFIHQLITEISNIAWV